MRNHRLVQGKGHVGELLPRLVRAPLLLAAAADLWFFLTLTECLPILHIHLYAPTLLFPPQLLIAFEGSSLDTHKSLCPVRSGREGMGGATPVSHQQQQHQQHQHQQQQQQQQQDEPTRVPAGRDPRGTTHCRHG